MKSRIFFVFVVLFCLGLGGCAVTPRTSAWESPKGKEFTKDVVYTAALRAGTENGWQATSSDRDAGTMSFMQKFGEEQMVLNAAIVDQGGGNIVVRTTANWGGGLAIRGHHEEFIRNFHVQLFRNLNVSEMSERGIQIQEIR